MPYRNAHWWILALFPLIAIAFWPTYFGQIRSAPFALHAHGSTAAIWLALLAWQSWSIHARRTVWHRAAGLATFLVLPLFAAAGPLALLAMIELFVGKSDPFHASYGARLALSDLIAGPTVIALTVYAFAQRRRLRAHAAAMLATALAVLPPVIARLFQHVPGFPVDGAVGMTAFELSFQLGEGIALAIALILARSGSRLPFGFAALATLAQMIGFATIGRAGWWEALVMRLGKLPAIPLAIAAGMGSLALLWWAWRRAPARPAPTEMTAPAVA